MNVVQDFDEAALAGLVHEYFGVPREQLHAAATLDALGLDSLALMELMVVLEDRSGIELLDQLQDLSLASTLREAARVIKTAACAAGSPSATPGEQDLPTPRDGG
ncbi:acyl carrier protein [Streptomyces sp. NPDC001594]|uniref:acyl carrier protein n=1 Tax=Streptomyces sp. NPDC001594 TaxID=3364590 RepID=UPI00369B64AB